MKKPIVLLVLVLTVIGAYAGINNYLSASNSPSKASQKAMTTSESSWKWESPSGKNTFSLDLLTDGTTITGTHCGVFNNGEK